MTSRRLIALLTALLLLPILAVTAATSSASASDDALFLPLPGFRQTAGDVAQVQPKAFKAYRVDLYGVRSQLSGGGTSSLTIPAPTGEQVTFQVAEDSILDAASQAAHPEIRTYAGHGADGSTVRLDVTPLGFHAMVRRPDGLAWYVDPAADRAGEDRVLSYLGGSVPTPENQFVERELKGHQSGDALTGFAPAPGGTVSTRTYQLALVTDPTYATYFGTANVLAAKTSLINRVNEVYNDDLAIKFILNGDPKLNLDTLAMATGTDGPCGASACFEAADIASCSGATLTRNEFVLGQLVGADTFDIGHIGLGTNGGGIAGLGVVGGASKADGCTGVTKPDGDFYAVDYVAHEMGHQMGGDHTFNGTQANCSNTNRNIDPYTTQVEPGSGSSIMAYAGICQQDNLQPHSDPYFSFASVDEINATTATAPGTENEVQTVTLAGFDTNGDSFDLTYPSASPVTITRGAGYSNLQVAQAIFTLTGCRTTLSGYDSSSPPLSDDGFTVNFNLNGLLPGDADCRQSDVGKLGVTNGTGGVTGFVGVQTNGGDDTNGGVVAATANHSPVVTAPAAKTIPMRTPFTLTGSATDVDGGDTLSYMWEQADAGGLAGTGLVDNTKRDGPLFRQFGVAAPVSTPDSLTYHSPGENLTGSSPSRTFPDLAQILAGNTNAATGTCPAAPAPPASGGGTNVPTATIDCYSEFLPTADWIGNPASLRVLHFRLTARDEFTPDAAADHAGGLSSANVALTVSPTAGPFLVTSQASSGPASGVETVKWNVAGTNTAALAQNVKISLSTDGGQTFPTVLVASTPNDGSQAVLIPNVTTSTVRIKVEAVGNYFFDVNDANFSIASSSAGHVAQGKGKFTSPKGSSTKRESAKGKAKFEFLGESNPSPSGGATFTFRKGKVAFTGDTVRSSKINGHTFKMKVTGTNKGKKGYTLVIVALDKGSKDKVRFRLMKGKKLVYDSMPGKLVSAKPKTNIKGFVTIT